MKIRASRAELADTLSWVAQAVPKRPQMPALAGMRLVAADGQLTASAFNYDLGHTAHVDVDVVTEGECLVSGHFLSWIVGSTKGETVELVLDGGELTVTAGRSTYRTSILKIEEYPRLPEQPAEAGTVNAVDLAEAVAAAKVTVDLNSPLTVLQALHVEGDTGELVIVGMRRQVAIEITIPWLCAKPFSANPLPHALDAAARGMNGTVRIGFDGGVLGLADGRRAVTMRVIEEEFPKWRVAIRSADDDKVRAVAELADLVDVVKRAGSLSDETTALAVAFRPDEIEVAIAAGERGAGVEAVPADCDGERLVGLHPPYLLHGLAAMPPGRVQLALADGSTGAARALTIRPVDQSDRVAVVMPKDLPGGAR